MLKSLRGPLAAALLLGTIGCGLQTVSLGFLSLRAPAGWTEVKDGTGEVLQLTRDGGKTTVKLQGGALNSATGTSRTTQMLAFVNTMIASGFGGFSEWDSFLNSGRRVGYMGYKSRTTLLPFEYIGFAENKTNFILLRMTTDPSTDPKQAEEDFKLLLASVTLLPEASPSPPSETLAAPSQLASLAPSAAPTQFSYGGPGAPEPTTAPTQAPEYNIISSVGSWLKGKPGYVRFNVRLLSRTSNFIVHAALAGSDVDASKVNNEVRIYIGETSAGDDFSKYRAVGTAKASGTDPTTPQNKTSFTFDFKEQGYSMVVISDPKVAWRMGWNTSNLDTSLGGQLYTVSEQANPPDGWPK